MNILSIDPDESWQKIIKTILIPVYCKIEDCNLETKEDLNSALSSIEKNEYQLIILELIISSGDESKTFTLLETLKACCPNSAKIIITGKNKTSLGNILKYNELVDAFFLKSNFKTRNQFIEEIDEVVFQKKCKTIVAKKTNSSQTTTIYIQKYKETYNMKIDAESLINNGIMADKVINKEEVTFNSNSFTEKDSFKKNYKYKNEKLSGENMRNKTKILIASANATDVSLRLDKEMKEIEEGLKRANHRDKFDLKTSLATTPQSLQRALLDYDPHIFHFSGHGEVEGIILEDNNSEPFLVGEDALASLFELFPNIECVLLNACHTEIQAKAIVQHIDYVIAMNTEIGDEAAIVFSVAFYDALGSGKNIEFSFQSAKVALKMAKIPEDLTPVLLTRKDFSHPPH